MQGGGRRWGEEGRGTDDMQRVAFPHYSHSKNNLSQYELTQEALVTSVKDLRRNLKILGDKHPELRELVFQKLEQLLSGEEKKKMEDAQRQLQEHIEKGGEPIFGALAPHKLPGVLGREEEGRRPNKYLMTVAEKKIQFESMWSR